LGESQRNDIIATTKEEVFEKLKENLRPEFLNRIDDKIMFLPLSKDEIKQIAVLLLKKIKKNLANRELALEINDNALSLLAEMGYDPQFGARPLKRVIETELVNELAIQVLSGEFEEGDTIYVDADKNGFVFSEEGFIGDGSSPTKENGEKSKSRRRGKNVKDLEKATKEVNELVKDIKDDEGNGAESETEPKKG